MKFILFKETFEKGLPPIDKLSYQDALEEVEFWRTLWSQISPDLRYWLEYFNHPIKIKTRHGQTIDGIMRGIGVNLDSITVEWVERIYNYAKSIATYEAKHTTVYVNNILDYSFIEGKEEKPEKYDGTELESIELDEKSILE